MCIRDSSCYDHLAGRAEVLLADRALARGWVVEVDGAWLLGPGQPEELARALGIAVELPDGRRAAVRPCLDWTERRPHLAGRLGAGLLSAFLDAGWLQRRTGDRALVITAYGGQALRAAGLDLD